MVAAKAIASLFMAWNPEEAESRWEWYSEPAKNVSTYPVRMTPPAEEEENRMSDNKGVGGSKAALSSPPCASAEDSWAAYGLELSRLRLQLNLPLLPPQLSEGSYAFLAR